MRRALLAVAVVAAAAVTSLAPAWAHGEYSGGWTDPAPGSVLDGLRGISGSVSHVHGIEQVLLQSVVPEDVEAGEECAASGGPWAPVSGGGAQQVSFTFQVVFPCNIVYRVDATAHAGAGEGTRLSPDPAPGPFPMQGRIAVAIPAAPVDGLDLRLAGPEDARRVVISWSEGAEPDIQRYVITRDGEVLGEVDAGDELEVVDADPPPGARSTYEVTAIRSGPEGDVAGQPADASIDVPERPVEDDEDDDASGDDPAGDDGDDGDDGGSDPALGSSSGPGGGTGPTPIGTSSRPVSGGPPTTLDTGFSETLPFDPAAPQEEQVAAPPTGDGSEVASFDDADEPPVLNQETWTFIAAGLALLMGSMVIRHVTRRAAAGY
jgi:hypothetical protein